MTQYVVDPNFLQNPRVRQLLRQAARCSTEMKQGTARLARLYRPAAVTRQRAPLVVKGLSREQLMAAWSRMSVHGAGTPAERRAVEAALWPN
jgi:hypothetical protein